MSFNTTHWVVVFR